MVVQALRAPVRGNLFVAALLKNLVSLWFLALIGLPILLANLYWLVSVNVGDLETAVRHWLNPSHYPLIAAIGGLVVAILLGSMGLQALLFPFAIRQLLLPHQVATQSRRVLGQVNARFWRQLTLVATSILAGLAVVVGAAAGIAALALRDWPGFVQRPAVLVEMVGIALAAAILLLIGAAIYRLAQILLVQAGVGVGRALARSLRLLLTHPVGFLAELGLRALHWLLIGLAFLGASGSIYWCLVHLATHFGMQTILVFGVIGMSLLVLTWFELLSWQQWAGYYTWLRIRTKPTEQRLLATSKGSPVRIWPIVVYSGVIMVVLVGYGWLAHIAQPKLQDKMVQLQQRLPDSSQRLIPSSRDIHYHVP